MEAVVDDKQPVAVHLSRPTPAANSNQVYKDLFAGTIGGITQVLAGQPFDIIKASTINCFFRLI
jgi:hypothetical protein